MPDYLEISRMRLAGARFVEVGGDLVDVSRAAHEAWAGLADLERKDAAQHVAGEAIARHDQWVARFFAGAWVARAVSGEMTRAEYVATLANLYSYVRYTTRLLGRAVDISTTTALRAHFARHLVGEVNHEILIERDLKALGAPVEWITKHRLADPGAFAFAAVQDAITARRDPVSFLACPLTAEGVSAAMGPEHIDGLSRAAASWGVDPAKVLRFLGSHLNTDGGEDGHHLAVIQRVREEVRDEPTLSRFLAVQRLAQDSFLEAFEECVGVTWV